MFVVLKKDILTRKIVFEIFLLIILLIKILNLLFLQIKILELREFLLKIKFANTTFVYPN